MKNKLIELGNRISELRKQRKITQEELAETIGYSTNHISKLESARTNPSFDLLVKISNALNIELKELFYFENQRINKESIKKQMHKAIDNINIEQLKILQAVCNALKENMK